MKIKSGSILKEVAGENVLIFLSPELKNKVITLNETGALTCEVDEGKGEEIEGKYDELNELKGKELTR